MDRREFLKLGALAAVSPLLPVTPLPVCECFKSIDGPFQKSTATYLYSTTNVQIMKPVDFFTNVLHFSKQDAERICSEHV